jgi:hypothetical protein
MGEGKIKAIKGMSASGGVVTGGSRNEYLPDTNAGASSSDAQAQGESFPRLRELLE